MAFRILVVVVGMMANATAHAYNAPDWIRHAPQDTGSARFYIGRASDASNETEGFNKALRSAYDAAIRENYGFVTKIDSESYETSAAADTIRRSRELSDEIQVRDFEQKDSYVEHVGDRYNVWLLFSYSKASIAAEKARLRSITTNRFSNISQRVAALLMLRKVSWKSNQCLQALRSHWMAKSYMATLP